MAHKDSVGGKDRSPNNSVGKQFPPNIATYGGAGTGGPEECPSAIIPLSLSLLSSLRGKVMGEEKGMKEMDHSLSLSPSICFRSEEEAGGTSGSQGTGIKRRDKGKGKVSLLSPLHSRSYRMKIGNAMAKRARREEPDLRLVSSPFGHSIPSLVSETHRKDRRDYLLGG